MRGHRREWGGLLHVWTVKVLEVVRPHLHESFYPEPVIRRTARPDDLGYFPAPDTVIGWQPPPAAFSAPVEFVALDVFEARIRCEYQRAAAGVVALIAPTAKADPVHRRALTDRLVGHLMEGAGVLVVDAVGGLGPSVTGDLLETLGLPERRAAAEVHALSLRPIYSAGPTLEAWQADLAVGAALPTMPLWVGRTEAVPVDLEASFLGTCECLRIPVTP